MWGNVGCGGPDAGFVGSDEGPTTKGDGQIAAFICTLSSFFTSSDVTVKGDGPKLSEVMEVDAKDVETSACFALPFEVDSSRNREFKPDSASDVSAAVARSSGGPDFAFAIPFNRSLRGSG